MLYAFLSLMLLLGFVSGILLFGPRIVYVRSERLPRLTDGSPPAGEPAVSVVIPARNEEHRIPTLLESLNAQSHQAIEVIVVDDESTDGTVRVCERYGARIVPAGDRPSGWIGKTWACTVGASEATGTLILFLDADVELSPHAIARLCAAHADHGGAISVQPYHRTRRIYESFSALFNAQAVTAVGVRGDARGLFGPCILMDRNSYGQCGGHESVRNSILDDVDLGRACRASGVPVRNYLGGKAIRYRMYPEGPMSMVNGWTKNFLRGAGSTPTRVLMLQSLWIIGVVTAFAQTTISLTDSSVAVFTVEQAAVIYAIFAILVGLSVRSYGSFGFGVAVTFPLHLLFFGFIMLRALWMHFRGGTIEWRGRRVCPDEGGCTDPTPDRVEEPPVVESRS